MTNEKTKHPHEPEDAAEAGIASSALLSEVEELREGFRQALDFMAKSQAEKMCMEAHHKAADRLAVKLGGESVARAYKY